MLAAALLTALAASQALAAPQVTFNYPGRSYQADSAGQFGDNQLSYTGAITQEKGYLKPTSEGGYVLVKEGFFKYTSPEGVPVLVKYYADDTGFHPTGDVIPVPPVAIQPAF